MFVDSGQSPFVFVSFIRCTPTSMGMGLYPRPRVLQLQSAIPYEPMRVFSCEAASAVER